MDLKQTSFRESREFLKGRQAEHYVAELLKKRGCYIIPSYDYAGDKKDKSPKMEGCTEFLIIPDLDISKDGTRCWIEVKWKATPTTHKITNIIEHGIPLRLFKHYLRVKEISGCKVFIFIKEEESPILLYEEIDHLNQVGRRYDGDKMSKGGMIFFPRDKFKKLG